MKKALIGGVSVLAVSAVLLTVGMSAASATDLRQGSLKDSPDVEIYNHNWSGVYIGGSAGFGTGDTSDEGTFEAYDFDVNGAIYGGHVGYNFQNGNLVFGLEAGINGTDMNGSLVPFAGAQLNREMDWYGTGVGRLGYTSGNTLFYGFGGVAWGDLKSTASRPAFHNDADSSHVGWTAGLGLEHALNDHFSVRAEYSHVDLGEEAATWRNGADDKIDLSFDAVKIGASYKFGGGY